MDVRVRMYDEIKEAHVLTLQECVQRTIGDDTCQINVDKQWRSINLADAITGIGTDIVDYIKLQKSCGELAIFAFKELNNQNTYNDSLAALARQALSDFSDQPVAFFIVKKDGSVNCICANEQILRDVYEQLKQIQVSIEEAALQPLTDDDGDESEPLPIQDENVQLVTDEGLEDGINAQPVVISFMGDATGYDVITHKDQHSAFAFSTKFSVHYAYEKYQPRKVIVLCTNGVSSHFNFTLKDYVSSSDNSIDNDTFSRIFAEHAYVDPIDNNMDIWELVGVFDDIIREYEVNPTDTLVIDVTHGYRIIPMFVMALFRYLTVIKGFNPDKVIIIYANYRQGLDQCVVYEVDEFRRMDVWTDAAKSIVHHGNARAMVALLSQFASEMVGSTDQHKADKSKVNALIGNFHKWTEVTQLALWERYPQEFARLSICIQDVLTITSISHEVRYVFEWIIEQFTEIISLAISIRDKSYNSPSEEIQLQEHMMKWYLECGMYTQAALLVREYLISKFLINHGTSKFQRGAWTSKSTPPWKEKIVRSAKDGYMPLHLNKMYTDTVKINGRDESLGFVVEKVRNHIAHGTRQVISATADTVTMCVNQAMSISISDERATAVMRELQDA